MTRNRPVGRWLPTATYVETIASVKIKLPAISISYILSLKTAKNLTIDFTNQLIAQAG
jgi:hypothetical protein